MFYKRLVEDYGQPFVDQLFIDKQTTVKWGIPELEELTHAYKEMLRLSPKRLISITKKHRGGKPI